MSYNIHHAADENNVLDLERIAKVIEDSGAEIIGLQEVDNHWSDKKQFGRSSEMVSRPSGYALYICSEPRPEPLNPGEPRRQYGTAVLSNIRLSMKKTTH